jgi:phosphoesterase RecJ-like protein
VADRLQASQSLLLTTHLHPDGDGLGSMVALAGCARRSGRSANLFLPEGGPERYDFLLSDQTVGDDGFARRADGVDCIVVLDTRAEAQLETLWDELKRRSDKIVIIDHHATGDQLSDTAWIDTGASAVGVQVVELLEHLGWPRSRDDNLALAAAITSDTGWLRFENTDARTLEAMARLVAGGVKTDDLYARLYQQDRPERLALQGRALSSLRLHAGGRIATMHILQEDFAQTGARADETENLVNDAMRIASVEVSIMLVKQEDRIRVNLRSRGHVDVSQIARDFGGGGHARAAGLRSELSLEDLRKRLITAAQDALGG